MSTGYGFDPRTAERPAKQRGSLTVIGLAVGAVLAFAALLFGFWGFLLTAVLMAVGAVVGRVLDGSLDLRSLGDVLRGRSSSR
ncbi:DUF2273 domain-containing protein [Microbacteriaceae bacterium VKM Ac-2854]|nr:DUF2273 domain-containing protein [Microbacteriaceae bacterium VKM Ac-2854]